LLIKPAVWALLCQEINEPDPFSRWWDLTATRFYHDSVPDIVKVQRRIFGLGGVLADVALQERRNAKV
jgi:hypothetical protein